MEFNKLKKALKSDFADLPVIKVAVLADSASRLFCQALKGYAPEKNDQVLDSVTAFDQ